MFPYDPLSPDKDQIRLLSIAPGEFSDDLRCSLSHVSLDDPPAYRALSYSWGDKSVPTNMTLHLFSRLRYYLTQWPLLQSNEIFLNGHVFEVTENLAAALHRIRSRTEHLVIWIDAICINQADLPERSKQVRKMRRIFQSAHQVFIWLGEAGDSSEVALQFVRDISKNCHSKEWLNKMVRRPTDVSHFDALFKLFQRQYWQRIWPVQEVNYAKNAIVYCGSDTIPWSELDLVSEFTSRYQVSLSQVFWASMNALYILMNQGPRSVSIHRTATSESYDTYGFLQLLNAHQENLATDAKDKIYALVGISPARDDPNFVIDYSLSVRDVYVSAVKYIVTTTQKLDIICLTRCLNNHGLPSWAPDWSIRQPFRGLHLRDPEITHAAGTTAAEARWSDNDNTLHAKGFCLDTIGAIGTTCEGLPAGLRHVLRIFHAWRNMLIAVKGSVEAYQEVFSRTIFCDTHPKTVSNAPPHPFQRLLAAYAIASLKILPDHPLDEQLQGFVDWTKKDGLPYHGWDISFVTSMCEMMRGRRFYVSGSEKQILGMAPRTGMAGDKICILFGCVFPVILRKLDGGRYMLIGESYVDGMMGGEALEGWKSDEYKTEEFAIC